MTHRCDPVYNGASFVEQCLRNVVEQECVWCSKRGKVNTLSTKAPSTTRSLSLNVSPVRFPGFDGSRNETKGGKKELYNKNLNLFFFLKG